MASPKFTQAAHTLVIIDDQKPSDDDILKLHDGYLSDLVKAIKMRTIPPREGFQRAIGLLPDEIDESEANIDRKSTRLNSSHQIISYAVFCLKKKKNREHHEKPSNR